MKKNIMLVVFLLLGIASFASKAPNRHKSTGSVVKKEALATLAKSKAPTMQLCLSESLVLPCSSTNARLSVTSCCVSSDCTIWDLFDSNDGAVSDYCFWQAWIG